MTRLTSLRSESSRPRSTGSGFALPGEAGARLLDGAPAAEGAESFAAHQRRLGPVLGVLDDPADLRAEVSDSAVTGRGGGSFPLARKLELAARSAGSPIVVVNGSEGEPASRKDQTLLLLRPHLVLDGAAAAAFATGATEIVVYIHRHRSRLHHAVTKAVGERVRNGWPNGVTVRVICGPDTYLAGESGALAAFLDGQGAIPRAKPVPLAARGVAGRPTVISNAETLAHLGLIARFGAAWYREAGTPEAPGSTLVTLAGEVTKPGLVLEVLEPVTMGTLLAAAGGWNEAPRAVLLGGYAGVWVDGARAWQAPLDRHGLAQAGAGLGCGLIGVLGHDRCGLSETGRLVTWLSSEIAGQCGPCAHGMPALADALGTAVGTPLVAADLARIHELAASIVDRGLCHLPDGTAALVYSALETFHDEVRAHRRFRRRCTKNHHDTGSPFPLPTRLAQ